MNQNVVIGTLAVVVVFIAGAMFFMNWSVDTPTAVLPTVTPSSNEVVLATPSPTPTIATSPTVSPATSPTGSPVAGAVKAFTISGSNFAFSSKEIKVATGDTVSITFKNDSGVHDLKVDGYGVGTKVLQAGASETIQFVANKAGTFEYYCSIGNHRQMGMKGSLIVQ